MKLRDKRILLTALATVTFLPFSQGVKIISVAHAEASDSNYGTISESEQSTGAQTSSESSENKNSSPSNELHITSGIFTNMSFYLGRDAAEEKDRLFLEGGVFYLWTLYGGNVENGELFIGTKGIKTGGLGGFKNIFFKLPFSVRDGDTMLEVTGTADLQGTKIFAGVDGSGNLADGDRITLIDAGNLLTDDETDFSNDLGTLDYGVSDSKTLTLERLGNKLFAQIGEGEVNPEKASGNKIFFNADGFYSVNGGKLLRHFGKENIYGGYIVAMSSKSRKIFGGNSQNGSADNNELYFGGGNFSGNIYGGGGGSKTLTANNNTITIIGGTFSGNIYGGRGRTTNYNAINIYGSPVLVGASLFGGVNGTDGSSSGNALNIYTSGLAVKNISRFQSLNFDLPAETEDGDTILEVTETADLSGTTVNVVADGATALKSGDKINLLTAGNLTTDEETNFPSNGTISVGVSEDLSMTVTQEENSIVGTVDNLQPSFTYTPNYKSDGNKLSVDGVNYQIDSAGREILPNNLGKIFGSYSSSNDLAAGDLTGGFATSGNVTGNTLAISGGEYRSEIFGGYSDVANVSSNKTEISGGTFRTNIFGGYSKNNSASGNILTISGGTFGGKILGGEGANSSDNVINISGNPNLRDAYIYAGRVETPAGYFAGTNNTINIYAKNLTAKNIGFAQNLNFYIPTSVGNGDTILTLTDIAGTDLSNVAIRAGVVSGNNSLREGDTVNLIFNSNGIKTNGGTSYGTLDSGVSSAYGISLRSEGGNTVIAHINSITAKEQTKVFTSSAESAQTTASVVTERLINWTPPQTIETRSIETPKTTTNPVSSDITSVTETLPFGSSGTEIITTTTTDGWIRSKVNNLDLGWAKTYNVGPGHFIMAPVMEYAAGDFDTYVYDSSNGRELYGHGTSTYTAGGFIARQINLNGTYIEASFRGGQMKITASSEDFVSSSGDLLYSGYSTSGKVLNSHVKIGRKINLSEVSLIDFYGMYLHTYQGKMDADLTTGEHYQFNSSNVGRTRIGFRLTIQPDELQTFYAGLAYQYDNNKGISATYIRPSETLTVPATGESGSSGMFEFGWQIKPSRKNSWSLDLTTTGFVGQNSGWTAGLKLEKTF